jgi:hypothetical protein
MQRLRRQDAEEERDGIVIFAVERTAFVETPESDRRAFAVLNDERQRTTNVAAFFLPSRFAYSDKAFAPCLAAMARARRFGHSSVTPVCRILR